MSKTTNFKSECFDCKFCAMPFSLLLNETASLLSLATHWLLPPPNRVMAAGKHPIGGKLVTPILLTPSPYNVCKSISIFSID